MSNVKTAARQFPVALKIVHDDIVRANPTSTLTTKQMRSVLRAKNPIPHARNASHVMNNQSEYDAVRALFDPAYASKIAKPARAPRSRKPTPAADAPASTDAE